MRSGGLGKRNLPRAGVALERFRGMMAPMSLPADRFNADYFLRGREAGVSLYENYRWLPDLTRPMVTAMAQYLGIMPGESVYDFGCARGYVVRALREQGYAGFGGDISRWAILNADPEVKPYVEVADRVRYAVDWIISKDVLEHVPEAELLEIIPNFMQCARRGIFIVVPLSAEVDGCYVVPEYEEDLTHVIRWPMSKWIDLVEKFNDERFTVWRNFHVPGIKDNYRHFAEGNGFIFLERKKCRRSG